jgi:23S rRNA (adenine2030-N6)-methyltransferase
MPSSIPDGAPMLSYRHAFHAGNHADVLKHFLVVQLLRYMCQKDKPFWYIESHAGAGYYALDAGYATKLAEHQNGIDRLWGRRDLPKPLEDYVDLVRQLNPDGVLRAYPGSPHFALKLMREQDRLRLFELHSKDSHLLQDNFREAGRRVKIAASDGYAGLKALLPPPPRRALILIDPAFEEKQDYQRAIAALEDGLLRFPTGTYALWYPLLQRPEARRLPEKLKQLSAKSWLNVSLTVCAAAPDGFGMHGSGMFLINPPWVLPDMLKETLPYLAEVLGQDAAAGFSLEYEGL